MVVICKAEQVMQDISNTYNINMYKKKGLPYGPPDVYLGTQIKRHPEPEDNSDSFWYYISGDHYVNNFVANA